MLKGHAKIELKDTRTGKIETYEHDNMITNAVASNINYANRFLGYSDLSNKFLPLHNNGMGGILLFQERLDENVDNVTFPSDETNPIVGYASNNAYSENDVMRGGRNLVESTEIENGYKYVWDFATSQANGVISALALTHSKCGAGVYRYDGNMRWVYLDFINTTSFVSGRVTDIVDFEFDTGILTKIAYISSTQINMQKLRIPINNIGIKTLLFKPELISSEIINVETANETDLWIKADDNYFYQIGNSGSNKKIVRIAKYNSEFAYQDHFEVQFSNNISFSTSSPRNAVIVNGHTYIMTYNRLYRINNTTQAKTEFVLKAGSASTSPAMLTELNGVLYSEGYVILNPENDDKIKIIERFEFYSSSTGCWDSTGSSNESKNLFINKDGCYLNFVSTGMLTIGSTYNYIATVNNLESPITKTSAQSMKITYTITEE